jgi:3-oxoacyl-[acyl-carrier protein] reductase
MSGVKREAEKAGVPVEAHLKKKHAEVPVGRFGTAEEFGDACAYLCSRQAEFIVGHNLLMDGGMFAVTV